MSATHTKQDWSTRMWGRPFERLDLLVVMPALINLLWVLDVPPSEPWGWILTVLMYASGLTWAVVGGLRWWRRRAVRT